MLNYYYIFCEILPRALFPFLGITNPNIVFDYSGAKPLWNFLNVASAKEVIPILAFIFGFAAVLAGDETRAGGEYICVVWHGHRYKY